MACLCVVIAATGCQSSSEETAVEPEAVAVAPAAPVSGAPAATPAGEPTPAAPADAAAATPAAPAANAVAQQPYTPPFPNRTDLFEPPRRTEGSARRGEESGGTIELKGFINVNGPRVVLSIDGVIAPIAEGEEKFGVKVWSIDPPSVVLERGRSRWTEKLE
jgi:hypothetical protein